MPLLTANAKTFIIEDHNQVELERYNINALKIVADAADNDFNTTTIFVYEGHYDDQTGEFTAFRLLTEIIIDAVLYGQLVAQGTAGILDSTYPNIYEAQKRVIYAYVASQLNLETGWSVV